MGRITLGQAAAWCGGQIDPKYEKIIHGAGFVALMALMVFVLLNDVYQIIFYG